MPGGNVIHGLAVVCCAIACSGCQTLRDQSVSVMGDQCAPSAPYEDSDALTLEETSPEVRELVSVAYAHHQNGEPDLAAGTLLDALEFEPDNRRVRTMLAITLALEGHTQAAELQFIESLGLAEANYNLGIIQFEQGEFQAASQRFLRAVQHDPNLHDARIWLDVARQELAAQTARWHTEISPLSIATRPDDIEVEESIVHLPQPLPVVQASAIQEHVNTTLPTIAPIQSAWSRGNSADSPVIEVTERLSGNPEHVSSTAVVAAARLTPSDPAATSTADSLAETPHATTSDVSEKERAELNRLRDEVQRLRVEHEILKKAIGVIAADDLGADRD